VCDYARKPRQTNSQQTICLGDLGMCEYDEDREEFEEDIPYGCMA
jgi:hypothetical protein